MDRIYSLEEISSILQVHIDTVRRYVKRGSLRAAKIGKAYRVQESDLKAFIEARIKFPDQDQTEEKIIKVAYHMPEDQRLLQAEPGRYACPHDHYNMRICKNDNKIYTDRTGGTRPY